MGKYSLLSGSLNVVRREEDYAEHIWSKALISLIDRIRLISHSSLGKHVQPTKYSKVAIFPHTVNMPVKFSSNVSAETPFCRLMLILNFFVF